MKPLDLILALLCCAVTASADVGPKPRTAGANPAPGGNPPEVGVRLVEEEIALELQGTDKRIGPHNSERLVVKVVFRFENPEPEDVRLEVGFPVGPLRNMHDFAATVGDQARTFRLYDRVGQREVPLHPSHQQFAEEISGTTPDLWYLWDEVFPAGKTVEMVVTYYTTIGGMYHTQRRTGYLVHTGAGWKGPIGRIRATLRITGTLTAAHLKRVAPRDGLSRAPDGQLVWERRDVEPSKADDFVIHYDNADTWEQTVVSSRSSADRRWEGAVSLAELLCGAGMREGRDLTPAEGEAVLEALTPLVGSPRREGENLVLEHANPDPKNPIRSYVGHIGNYLEPVLRLTVEACLLMPGDARALERLATAMEVHEACVSGRLVSQGAVQSLSDYDQRVHGKSIAGSIETARALLGRK